MQSLSQQAIVSRRSGPLTAAVDDELVMLDTQTSTYYGLDRIGRRIWELIEQPLPVGDLCATLEREFDVSAATCRADVLAFLDRMGEARLIEVR